MLARRFSFEHPLCGRIETPIIIPSFTSKGFAFYEDTTSLIEYSQANKALKAVGPRLENTLLLSAYDIHFKYFESPEDYFENRNLIFIDSGGYELSPFYDSTEPIQPAYKSKDFNESGYREILKSLSKKLPFVISNFDWGTRGKAIQEQVLSAQKLFNDFPKFGHNFLLKPVGNKRYLDISQIKSEVGNFRKFHILGVTEKELGRNVLDRLVNLAKLRLALNEEKISIPIHVWGGLDPLMTPLYFFAGGDIFDGVSWLRYTYHEGLAVYRDSLCILNSDMGIDTPSDQNWAFSALYNLIFLRTLSRKLKLFVDGNGKTFEMFGKQKDVLKKAYLTLCSEIPQAKGD